MTLKDTKLSDATILHYFSTKSWMSSIHLICALCNSLARIAVSSQFLEFCIHMKTVWVTSRYSRAVSFSLRFLEISFLRVKILTEKYHCSEVCVSFAEIMLDSAILKYV